jgi:hypothetical protein
VRGARFTRGARQSVAAAGLVLAVALLAAGGSSVRTNLGTSDSPCYRALPVAASALHVRGHFFGVRLIRTNSLPAGSDLRAAASRGGSGNRTVCLVGFSGPFRQSDVDQPLGLSSASAAIVVVSYPGNELLGTVLVSRPTLRFSHMF